MHQETSNELDQCTWYQGSQTDFFNIRSLQTRPIIFLFFFSFWPSILSPLNVRWSDSWLT